MIFPTTHRAHHSTHGEPDGAGAQAQDSLVFADGERGTTWVNLTKLHSRADVFIVLVPPLILFCVGCQMRIHNADAGVMELEPDGHTSFVTLSKGAQRI